MNHIRWDKPQQEYIPENTEEDDRIAVRNFSASKKYPEQKVNVTPKALIGLVNLSQNYESLLLAKAFWREGMVYYKNFQYIQAFYHFYFVLEDFYISGKSSSKKSVMKKLQESSELQDIANSALHQTQNLSGHKTKLQKFLLEYNCANTASGLLEMLYEIRNHLHHFHSKSTKIQGTPFNQSNFDTIALAMMHIVTLAISYREVKITQSLKTAKAS